MPDSVWQIVLVSLLWTFEYYGWEQAQLLREGTHQFRLVRSGAETADWQLAVWTAAFIRRRRQQGEGPLSGAERDWNQSAGWHHPWSLCVRVLGVPENKPILESDLEKLLSYRLKSFFWNLGEASCLLEPSSAWPWTIPTTMWTWYFTTKFSVLMYWLNWKRKTDTRGCRSAQYVLKLLCGRSQRPWR